MAYVVLVISSESRKWLGKLKNNMSKEKRWLFTDAKKVVNRTITKNGKVAVWGSEHQLIQE